MGGFMGKNLQKCAFCGDLYPMKFLGKGQNYIECQNVYCGIKTPFFDTIKEAIEV